MTTNEAKQRIRKAIEAERQHPPLTKLRPLPEPKNDGQPKMVTGTPRELLQHAVETFKKLSPEKQECYRQRLYEIATGKPFRKQ
jgi:hypothetical protein